MWSYLQTRATFPVPTGSTVELSCSNGLALNGEDTITCFGGGHYNFNAEKKPTCTESNGTV